MRSLASSAAAAIAQLHPRDSSSLPSTTTAPPPLRPRRHQLAPTRSFAAPSLSSAAARSSRSTKRHRATDASRSTHARASSFLLRRGYPSREGAQRSMSLAKRYVLRLFISLKYVTANVVDRQSGRVVTTASTAERPLRDGLECGRACNAKAAAAVGEVLAMRLKVDGLAREPIHADAAKEVAKKGFKNQTKVWAILNALRNHGVNLRIDDDGDHRRHV